MTEKRSERAGDMCNCKNGVKCSICIRRQEKIAALRAAIAQSLQVYETEHAKRRGERANG
jgi:hypothetical protein